jgi:hypothetical protein
MAWAAAPFFVVSWRAIREGREEFPKRINPMLAWEV